MLQVCLIVSSLCLDICVCCESNRSDNQKLAKKIEETENLGMELEIELQTKDELKIAHEQLNTNYDTIVKFKKDVTRFLVTTDKMDKNLVDLPALTSTLMLGSVSYHLHHEIF